MTVHIVHYVSPSGGYRGFSTFETRGAALTERSRLTAKGYRVRISTEWRDSESSTDAKFDALRGAIG